MLNIYEARTLIRQSQHRLAKEVGFSQSKFSLIEKGYLNPKPEDREKIARALSMRVADIDWEGERI